MMIKRKICSKRGELDAHKEKTWWSIRNRRYIIGAN